MWRVEGSTPLPLTPPPPPPTPLKEKPLICYVPLRIRVGGVGGVAAAPAVVEAGEVRHWECCVKRVEASERQTKEAAATFSAPPPPRADCPSDGATRKKTKHPRPPAQGSGTLLLSPADQIPGTGTTISGSHYYIVVFFHWRSLGGESFLPRGVASVLPPPLAASSRLSGLCVFGRVAVVGESWR